MNMNEPPSLLRNEYAGGNGWIEVKLVGTRSNRAGVGATVVATVGGWKQARPVLSQSSYYSHDDLRLHFGLGGASRVDAIEVVWPSGGAPGAEGRGGAAGGDDRGGRCGVGVVTVAEPLRYSLRRAEPAGRC